MTPTAVCYYRISLNSTSKERIADKFTCLYLFCDNLSKAFDKVYVYADNVDEDFIQEIDSILKLECYCEHEIKQISIGNNSMSFLQTYTDALNSKERYEWVYFAEDDYLYSHGAHIGASAGMNDREFNYFTLYDHPDKYGPTYKYGEKSIVRYNKMHWRTTCSTTMTFFIRHNHLKAMYPCALNACGTSIPQDHWMWTTYLESLGSAMPTDKLWVCLKPYATHAEVAWLTKGIDWEEVIENHVH